MFLKRYGGRAASGLVSCGNRTKPKQSLLFKNDSAEAKAEASRVKHDLKPNSKPKPASSPTLWTLSGHQGSVEEDAEGLWEEDAVFGHCGCEALDREGGC